LNQPENTTIGMKTVSLDLASIALSMPKTGCFVTSKNNRGFAAQQRRRHSQHEPLAAIGWANHIDPAGRAPIA
jgi:hypothetical protein